MTQSEFVYNKFDYKSLDQDPQKYHNDNGANFTDQQKQWFFIPYDQWFLNRDEKEPMQGNSSWFDSVVGIVKKATKAIKRRRIDFSETKIVIAKDPELLKQYYDLREKLYRKKLGFAEYDGQENDFDKIGDIVLALYNGKVVAGARLDFSDRHISGLMYNDNPEDNGFTYKDIIKKFDGDFRDDETYSEICGLAVDDRVNRHFFGQFFKVLLDHSKNMGTRYIVGVAYQELCKTYNVILSQLKCNFKIYNDIEFKLKHSGHGKFNFVFSPLIMRND